MVLARCLAVGAFALVGPVLFQEVIKWTGPLAKIRWTYDELEGIVS